MSGEVEISLMLACEYSTKSVVNFLLFPVLNSTLLTGKCGIWTEKKISQFPERDFGFFRFAVLVIFENSFSVFASKICSFPVLVSIGSLGFYPFFTPAFRPLGKTEGNRFFGFTWCFASASDVYIVFAFTHVLVFFDYNTRGLSLIKYFDCRHLFDNFGQHGTKCLKKS